MVNIIGHGPSLKGKGLGKEIDSDPVVRLKGGGVVLGTEDYGSRVDAVCASTEVMGLFRKIESPEYWAYPKKGYFDGKQALDVIVKLEKPVMIPLRHCNYWNERFRDLGARHPNVSTGMAAIIISILRFKPKEIRLFGFDTLMNPDLGFSRNMEIPRSGHGAYPDHDWQKERELLTILSNVYKVDIHD